MNPEITGEIAHIDGGRSPGIRIADASLRFYLAMERSARELSRSGRAAAAELINRRWASWRGRAVERPAFAGRFG